MKPLGPNRGNVPAGREAFPPKGTKTGARGTKGAQQASKAVVKAANKRLVRGGNSTGEPGSKEGSRKRPANQPVRAGKTARARLQDDKENKDVNAQAVEIDLAPAGPEKEGPAPAARAPAPRRQSARFAAQRLAARPKAPSAQPKKPAPQRKASVKDEAKAAQLNAGAQSPEAPKATKRSSRSRASRSLSREELFSPEPKTRAQKAEALRQEGSSMSALLQNRSEAAAEGRSSLTGQKRGVESQASPAEAEPLSPVPDIDSKDKGNPLACAEYVKGIYDYYMRVEDTLRAAPAYMDATQNDINVRMRGVLIDWIVEVHLKFKLMPETLFLTVNLIDRYLEKVSVGRKKLQLVGISALLIASKYEEIWAPEVRDFISICDHAYTRVEIIQMEKNMLIEVGWRLTVPSTYNFLARFLKAANCYSEKEIALFSAYLGELALVDYKMLKWKSSEIAAAAVHIARMAVDVPDPYPYALRKHSTYRLEDLKQCVADLDQLRKGAEASLLKAVYRKYSSEKFHAVAKMPVPKISMS